ncbi:hypothetical protein EQH57_0739 [Dictyocoela roeselum]|jgi:hypothetical protein|nr:hypothetical protein EQH57_0739 [Dictyocoela roeselum]
MECVPDFTIRVHPRLIIAVQSGIGELDRERMRPCRKSSRTSPSQWRRYTTGVQKSIVRCNSDSRKRESDETIQCVERDWKELVRAKEFIRRKALDSTFSRRDVCVEPPHMCEAYSIQGQTTPL